MRRIMSSFIGFSLPMNSQFAAIKWWGRETTPARINDYRFNCQFESPFFTAQTLNQISDSIEQLFEFSLNELKHFFSSLLRPPQEI